MKNSKELTPNDDTTEAPRTVEIDPRDLENIIGGRATICIVYEEEEHF